MNDNGVTGFFFWTAWVALAFVVLYLLAACVPAELEPPAAGPIPITREETVTPPPVPTETGSAESGSVLTPTPTGTGPVEFSSDLTPTPTGTGPVEAESILTATPTPWQTLSPDTRPSPTPAPLFPGMVYRYEDDLWKIAADWQPELLAANVPGAKLSPNGQQILFQLGDQLWLFDMATGQGGNLTGDSGRHHCCPQWWPEQPGRIVFGSWPADADLGPTTGFLSVMNDDGSDYTVLDEEVQSNGLPAPGPDGQTIAYDRAGTAWLYRPETGPVALDLAAFGLQDIVRIGGPAWSPDGQQLAWTVAVQDPDWRIALAIFDLANESAWLLHPYQNIGRGGWFPPPAWSPDGRWLAFAAEDVNPENRGLWVVSADESEEHYLGLGTSPLWSPDGRWLAYVSYLETASGQERLAQLVEAGSWYTIQLALPSGAEILDWQE